MTLPRALLAPALLLLACGEAPPAEDPFMTTPLQPEAQRAGDPAAGYRALLNNGYVSCGIPYTAYAKVFPPITARDKLPDHDQVRDARNRTLPYYMNAFRTRAGVEVVAPNCLVCHSERIGDQIVVGLGNVSRDLTEDQSTQVALAAALLRDPAEIAEANKFAERMAAVGPYTLPRTIGVNAADNLAAVLFAHRDPTTLAWSSEPLLELPPEAPVPVDVPPWWRMGTKAAMFYNGAGRGDHARIMMTASTLCTDSVADAQAIDGYFNDVRAYIASLGPPRYPYPTDAAKVAAGQGVFAARCARCHGSYGAGGSYPNLVIPLREVGTDTALARDTAQFAGRFVDWFNRSFYGQAGHLQPLPGYVAPSLLGVWATAPYLHNGSVPTLAALLQSDQRPRYWTRDFAARDFDPQAVGYRTTALQNGQDAETDGNKRKRIYDTTLPGYGNGGHTFGDALTAEERSVVIEYLKTL